MKKWASLLFGTMLMLAMPVSAFATGLNADSKLHVNVDGDGKIHANLKVDGGAKVDSNVKLDEVVKADLDGKLKVEGKSGVDAKVVLDPNVVRDAKVTVDGLLDKAWDTAERVAFQDPATGLNGHFRLMWDNGELYVLAELHGAAKVWKDNSKPFLLSMFYNGDQEEGDGKNMKDGWLALSWPNMEVVHGDRDGCLKVDKLVKSFAVNGDDVNVEFKIPWEHKDGLKMNADTELGLFLKLKELDAAKADANGQVTVPVVTESQVLSLKPSQIPVFPLQLVDSLPGLAADNGTGSGTDGTSGTGGTTVPGTGSGTGGTTVPGGSSDNGGTTTPGSGGTGSGVTISPDSGTAVGGVSDNAGVIPAAMPQTGGGGASDWTD